MIEPPFLTDIGKKIEAAEKIRHNTGRNYNYKDVIDIDDSVNGQSNDGLKPASNISEQTGLAWQLGAEFVSGFVVGSLIGWLIDRWLGTKLWFFVIFFILGGIAGTLNLLRAVKRLNKSGDIN